MKRKAPPKKKGLFVTLVQQPAVQGAVATGAMVVVLSGQIGEWLDNEHEVPRPAIGVHHLIPLAHVLSSHVVTSTPSVALEPDDYFDLRIIIPPGLPPVK